MTLNPYQVGIKLAQKDEEIKKLRESTNYLRDDRNYYQLKYTHASGEVSRLRKALEDVKTELLNNGYIDVDAALQSSFKIINQALEPTKGEDTQ